MPSKAKRLAKGRKLRQRTAQTLIKLQEGDVGLVEVLGNPPPELKRVRLYVLMERAPGMGETGVDTCLKKAKVWPTTRLGHLTPEERDRVVQCLPQRAKGGRT